ncbi:MAG: nuclear transport factor 2 family protein [Bacteroidia bacterium]|nr:nuclear transport factor 2 family protein [Bacteroidia bacterium]
MKHRFALALILTGICISGCGEKKEAEKEYFQKLNQWVKILNEHKDTLSAEYLAEEFSFTDARGQELKGRERVMMGWQQLFRIFPDYTIDIESTSSPDKNTMAVFGYTSGTYLGMHSEAGENHWKIPTAWRISFDENGRICRWKEYGDTKIIYEIIRSNQPDTDF